MGRRPGAYEAIGRRMRMTKSQQSLTRALKCKILAAQDWLCAANRAICVSLGQANRRAGRAAVNFRTEARISKCVEQWL